MSQLSLWDETDIRLIAGVDEAGRGPLAGPVVAGAVILDPNRLIAGLNDSKKLSEKKREALFDEIQQKAISWSIAYASVEEIDELNILHASMLAMRRAVEGLTIQPDFVRVDGNRLPRWTYPSEPIVGGDASVACIAAASILAKVQRDRDMIALDRQYPDYGFAQHKGYPTKLHLEKLRLLGVNALYRKSFRPVAELIGCGSSE